MKKEEKIRKLEKKFEKKQKKKRKKKKAKKKRKNTVDYCCNPRCFVCGEQ